ncbi:hypothetical protein [Enterococcus avium]|uniref:hypothetical protein n=1 Tax=Enterococcus avium TaxID=33945 RepID=UPI00288CCA73|nr:hypothetical protein [Enterococcus avium]MDT2461476.1 hypothetical protein [Enterococcus avium]
MDDSLKKKIIESLKKQLPEANEERLKTVLELILLEIESYNTCGNEISWKKLQGAITEVLYQSMKSELETTVSSVKRGDTTISYANKSNEIKGLLAGYDELIKRIIGCGGLEFF